MNTAVESIAIRVVTADDARAESLNNLFRNAGHAVTASTAADIESVAASLDDVDLVILAEDAPITGDELRDTLSETPWIALLKEHNSDAVADCLEQGAADAIAADETRHLVAASLREIRHHRAQQAAEKASRQLAQTSEKAEQLLDNAPDAIAYYTDGMILDCNETFAELFAYDSTEDLECQPLVDMVAVQDQDKLKAFLKGRDADSPEADLTISGLRHDGSEFLTVMNFSASSHEGEPCLQILIRPDEADAESGLSFDDPVTGLFNRRYFTDHLEAALLQAANATTVDHVLYICIDKFNALVKQYGLPGADAILKDLADIVRNRADKFHYLSRFGDNSLAMLLPNSSADSATVFATELCKEVEEHIFEMGDQTVQYTCSVGISVLNAKSPRDPVALIDQCRQAVEELREEADEDGKGNGANVFTRVRKVALDEEGAGEEAAEILDLDEAIEQDLMRLLFQPLLSLKGDSGDHYEAFVRMLSTNEEEVPPSQFMDQLNKENGIKLDRWVILEAMKQLSAQREDGSDTRLFINLTPYVIEDDGLVPWLKVAMQAANIPPEAVIFQLTEEDMMRNVNQAKAFIDSMRGINCRVGMTHFGNSTDPKKSLKHLDVDYVKLAPNFTTDIQDGSGDPQPLKDMVNTINSAEKKSVVPQVENASVLATLWQAGANFIQGHYVQPPTPEMNYEFSEIA